MLLLNHPLCLLHVWCSVLAPMLARRVLSQLSVRVSQPFRCVVPGCLSPSFSYDRSVVLVCTFGCSSYGHAP